MTFISCPQCVFVIWCYFFLFNDTATTEIYTYLHTLSLHDALPIFTYDRSNSVFFGLRVIFFNRLVGSIRIDRHRIALCQPCKAMILVLKIDGVAAFNRLLVQLRPLLVDGQLALGLLDRKRAV